MCRFIKVEELKEKLLENNKQTYWVPDFVKVRYLHANNAGGFFFFFSFFGVGWETSEGSIFFYVCNQVSL